MAAGETSSALVSFQGYDYYNHNVKNLRLHSKWGCLICSKILATLEDNDIEDVPSSPGWVTFLALDRNRRYLKDVSPDGTSFDHLPF